jgi:translation initiation factor 3 subunit C
VKQPGDTSSESEGDASWLDDSQESGEEKEEKKATKAKPGAKTKKHKAKTTAAAVKAEVESNEEEDDEEDARAAMTASRQRAEPLEEEKDDLKAEDVDRLTGEMAMLRGRKGTDYPRLLQRLELILPKAKSDQQRIRLLILFVNTRFDSVRTSKSRLSAKDWRVSVDHIKQILKLLRANPTFRLMELDLVPDLDEEDLEQSLSESQEGVAPTAAVEDEAGAKKRELVERNKGLAASVTASGKVVISGSLYALLERLDSAFVRTLQQIDPHTQEYLTRLSDDPEFVALARDMLAYQLSIADTEGASKTAHSIMSHIYFKNVQADTAAELQRCATIIYSHGSARLKAQAMLMSIYHLALQDNFEDARDRMLMSHLQDKASLMDIETQILFNRTNVQIGLCAFRAGLIREAHSALSEIYAGGRVKELLAQGTSSQRYQDKDKEQEKVEKSRMMPFHMHINLELLETCHLIAAMMLEVPVMAAERYSRGAVVSDNKIMSKLVGFCLVCFLFVCSWVFRYLRKLVDYHERQVFAGPPETTRDFVVAAARALSRGNWRKTTRLLLNMPAWELLEKKVTTKKTEED